MKIYISPSVQENNIGAGNYGTEEKRMNQIADIVCPLLTYNGFEVCRNRPEMSLYNIVADSNAKKVDVHFAIHSNAGGGRGGEVFYYGNSVNGKRLASSVYRYLEPLTPTGDRGVKQTWGLYELKNTNAPAALIEVAFHDNPDDAQFILNNIQALGEAIAKGICEYAGKQFIKPEVKPVQPSTGVVIASVLNVRSGAGISCPVIGTLKQGATVRIDKKVGDWYSIYFGDHGGYVYAQYIRV